MVSNLVFEDKAPKKIQIRTQKKTVEQINKILIELGRGKICVANFRPPEKVTTTNLIGNQL